MRTIVLSLLLGVLALNAVTAAQTTREVTYDARSIIRVNAKLRFTTLIILPDNEEILDFVCGDKDVWVVSGAQNFAYVKPGKAGASTNLNLVTAAGHVYSFVLTEGAADPDLKITVTADQTQLPSLGGSPRFYPAVQVDALRRELADARQETETAKTTAVQDIARATAAAADSAEGRVTAFRRTFPTTLAFPYRYVANAKPFFVTAMFHDEAFTYIRSDAPELPSLYEIRDGMPNLVNFQVEHGTYIVPKVLERGYLVIGKQKWTFDQRPVRRAK